MSERGRGGRHDLQERVQMLRLVVVTLDLSVHLIEITCEEVGEPLIRLLSHDIPIDATEEVVLGSDEDILRRIPWPFNPSILFLFRSV